MGVHTYWPKFRLKKIFPRSRKLGLMQNQRLKRSQFQFRILEISSERTKITALCLSAIMKATIPHVFPHLQFRKLKLAVNYGAPGRADQNIVNNNDRAWPRTMSRQFGGCLFRIGKLFLCHRDVASSSEHSCRSKANPCSYTFQYEGTRDSRTWKRRNSNCVVHES